MYLMLLLLIHIHKLMVTIHWSIPTSMIKNKFITILRNKEFQAISRLIFSPSFPTSSSLETIVQSHVIFLLRAPGSCVVRLEKRDYNKMAASILIDGAITLKTFMGGGAETIA